MILENLHSYSDKNSAMHRLLSFLSLIFILSACQSNPSPDTSKQVLYHGGDILTMAGDAPELAEALVTDGAKIVWVGRLSGAKKAYPKARSKDLKGATLLPGFIDGHAHFAGFPAQAVGAQILPSPDSNADSIDMLVNNLKEWGTPENIALTGWIFGIGFDDSVIKEKRFPTKADLDKVSTEHPVMAVHISGHFCVVNSKGLEALGISSQTPDPEGGIIRRVAGTQEPDGVLEELAAIPLMAKAISPKSQDAVNRFLVAGQEMALSYGYTTVQEGRAMESSHQLLESAANTNFLKLDVVSYVDYTIADKLMATPWNSRTYKNRYRIGGVKITLDGSPQGRTAWITEPYLVPPDNVEEGYRGYPAIPDDKDVTAVYEQAFKNGWQILTHGNGDAAMDQMIRTLGPVTEKYGNEGRRDVLIHGQYVRVDQLDSFKKLNVIPSLFPLHTFYWGDWHKQLIGEEKGNFISPTRTALDKGLKLTIHTDAPVALPNLMRLVWTATNRTSRSGAIIGEKERLTPYEALKAVTDWSAYQHFEEDQKGTLEVGKLADLVVLDQNPHKVALDQIKDIIVLETIKEGEPVFVKH